MKYIYTQSIEYRGIDWYVTQYMIYVDKICTQYRGIDWSVTPHMMYMKETKYVIFIKEYYDKFQVPD